MDMEDVPLPMVGYAVQYQTNSEDVDLSKMGYTQKILGCWGMLVDHWVLRHYRFKRMHLEVDQYPRWAAKESV